MTSARDPEQHELAPVVSAELSPELTVPMSQKDVAEHFLKNYRGRTRETYLGALRCFAEFLIHSDDLDDLGRAFFALQPGHANQVVLKFCQELESGKATGKALADATIRVRLAAIKSFVKLARTLGMIVWSIDVQWRKREDTEVRDMSGPDADAMQKLKKVLLERRDAKGIRDYALIRVLHDLGLRRAEASTLDIEHADIAAQSLTVLRKGRTKRRTVSMPRQTADALKEWIQVRGDAPGALFTSFERMRGHAGQRLTPFGIYRVVQRLGALAGISGLRPHGFRHRATTAALDATGGDVRAVTQFRGDGSPDTTLRYDDARRNPAAKIAQHVADAF